MKVVEFKVDRKEAIRTAFRLVWKAFCFNEIEIEVRPNSLDAADPPVGGEESIGKPE
jgi:hypothetical protein